MAQVKDLIVNGSANVLGTIYGNLVGNASTATILATGRTIRTNLGSTSAVSFNGSQNITPGVTGTLPIANGGTGATTAAAALTALGLTATAAELNYCDGVTSNIQTQLNGKQATISLTASRALVSNSSGKIAVSAVTATELGYLDGVTSAIQTQINNCMKFSSGTTAPSDTSGKTAWYDTTNKVLKFYVNGA